MEPYPTYTSEPLAGPMEPPPLGGPAEINTGQALARIDQLNPLLHAVIAVDPTAMDQARAVDASPVKGPLAGEPILIKDNIETAGALPTTAGSLALANNVTGRDSPLVARLRAAGAVILGKANLSEWANIRSTKSISGWSAVGGQARNPYAVDRNPCGSSSGSGVAVASGMVRMAIGTETDGSVTCPAAINGIVGMKPTVGLVSRTHIIPISASQDTAGPMTATVREAAQLLTIIGGSDPADAATREADERKTDYAAALDANSLSERGAILVDIKEFDNKDIGDNEFEVLLTEFKAGLNDYLRTSPAPIPVRS
ncbi:MAG: amidase, partial [Sphingomonas sp.]|nr:amidase [Sphingomonas sp.]